ncbi:NAD(P)H oxidoreductase, partial [bacterium]|nr:NAD(P)H oxidoreductase [bacterium]
GAENLRGKIAFSAVTAGGTRQSYDRNGFNHYTLQEFLFPFEQTAFLCGMHYLPPFAVQGTYRLGDAELTSYSAGYSRLLEYLALDEIPVQEIVQHPYLNDWLAMRRQGTGS